MICPCLCLVWRIKRVKRTVLRGPGGGGQLQLTGSFQNPSGQKKIISKNSFNSIDRKQYDIAKQFTNWCPDCPVHHGFPELVSFPGSLVLAVLSRLSFPGCPFQAILSNILLSCPVLAVCRGCPFLAVLSSLFLPGCPILAVVIRCKIDTPPEQFFVTNCSTTFFR
jgi:hypothetical protein